jgi:DNA-binding CsgD family transcriptional regulator
VSKLTKREKECLIWAADGKTSWETAKILGVSNETVAFHHHNAMTKLGSKTKNHAVARALSLGLLVKESLSLSQPQQGD